MLEEAEYRSDWAVFTNFSRKTKSCSFCLKIHTSFILEVMIPNLDLDFQNSNHIIYFRANLSILLAIILTINNLMFY